MAAGGLLEDRGDRRDAVVDIAVAGQGPHAPARPGAFGDRDLAVPRVVDAVGRGEDRVVALGRSVEAQRADLVDRTARGHVHPDVFGERGAPGRDGAEAPVEDLVVCAFAERALEQRLVVGRRKGDRAQYQQRDESYQGQLATSFTIASDGKSATTVDNPGPWLVAP